VGPCRVFAPQTDLRGVVGVNRLGLLHIAEHRGADSTLRWKQNGMFPEKKLGAKSWTRKDFFSLDEST